MYLYLFELYIWAPSSTVYFNEFFKGYTVEEGAPFPLEEFIEEMEPPPLRCTPWRIHWRNGAPSSTVYPLKNSLKKWSPLLYGVPLEEFIEEMEPPPMGLYWNLYGTSECSN